MVKRDSTAIPPGSADKMIEAHSQENPLSLRSQSPVPQTDTGGRVEDTEALERFTVKELGKLTP